MNLNHLVAVCITGEPSEKERVRAFMDRCESAGFDVRLAKHEGLDPARAWSRIIDCIAGCDACVFFVPESTTPRVQSELWARIGASQVMGNVTIYVGTPTDSRAMSECTVVADDDAAFAALSGVAP